MYRTGGLIAWFDQPHSLVRLFAGLFLTPVLS